MLEAGSGADFRLLEARQGVAQQCGVTDQVLSEQLLAVLVGMDVLEHGVARVGHQADGLVAAIAALGQIARLAQADQIAFLEVEQWFAIDQRMQQPGLDNQQLLRSSPRTGRRCV